jgi:hypothetical protein
VLRVARTVADLAYPKAFTTEPTEITKSGNPKFFVTSAIFAVKAL